MLSREKIEKSEKTEKDPRTAMRAPGPALARQAPLPLGRCLSGPRAGKGGQPSTPL